MLPLVGVPQTIAAYLSEYRDVFCRREGFGHISRYITGLLLSQNKTLQGIYAQQVWEGEKPVSRRAMHAAVFEAGWESEKLMPQHRQVVAFAASRSRQGSDWHRLDICPS